MQLAEKLAKLPIREVELVKKRKAVKFIALNDSLEVT